MAVTVKTMVVTALAAVPANIEVAYGKGHRVGGVTLGQIRFTDPGGSAAGRFSSTTPASVFSDSANPVSPGVVTSFAMFSTSGGDVVADSITIENQAGTSGIYKLEFLDPDGVVVGTFTATAGGISDKVIPISVPVIPIFWTALAGTREVV